MSDTLPEYAMWMTARMIFAGEAMSMRMIVILGLCALSSACAAPIAAWKGRAYGEHSINPGKLITMSGTFRTGRVSSNVGEPVILCLEPFPEVAALMGGTDKLTGQGFGVDDGATPVLSKGHDSSTRYQEASLAYTIACNERINGVLLPSEYKAKVNAIIDNLTASLMAKPAAAARSDGAAKPAGTTP